ncbi:MAG: phosphoribosyltransferase domain-containing protein [Clostridia bacterium]|nr:phosphoribosyltransferase domain-containing protein [Clostridia bacterium]
MKEYFPKDVLRLAKRVNNTKRTFLLVNPLQAKHMPVKPSVSLEMMHTLGRQLAGRYPEARLIVGFAETATAIGAAVCECFPDDCVYMHTTREETPSVKDWIIFQEEHSHATEQKLAQECFLKALQETKAVLFIEDEISTGRTLKNMIVQLRGLIPQGKQVDMVAASIINRMSAENERALTEEGIKLECLVRLPEEDYTKAVENFSVRIAEKVSCDKNAEAERIVINNAPSYPDPRQGAEMGAYKSAIGGIIEKSLPELCRKIPENARVLVLGTEECMYPALMLGLALEAHCSGRVFCHATTRSPIGISDEKDYPAANGRKLTSLYQNTRETYIYNLDKYEAAVIVTDAPAQPQAALSELASALHAFGTEKVFIVNL